MFSALFIAVVTFSASQVVAVNEPVTMESAKKYNYNLEGDVDAFLELVKEGAIPAYFTDEDGNEDMISQMTVAELGAQTKNAVALEEADKSGRELQTYDISTQCPLCPGSDLVAGPAFANDAVLTVNWEVNGFPFCVRITCGEDCCARQWQCTEDYCTIECGTGPVTGRPVHFRIFRFTFESLCCRIEGRVVQPFPFGDCFDALLCASSFR